MRRSTLLSVVGLTIGGLVLTLLLMKTRPDAPNPPASGVSPLDPAVAFATPAPEVPPAMRSLASDRAADAPMVEGLRVLVVDGATGRPETGAEVLFTPPLDPALSEEQSQEYSDCPPTSRRARGASE